MNFKLNWKGIVIPLISLVSLILGRKRPILRWILAIVTMVLICMVSMFALSTLKLWFVIFPLLVIVLNIIVCLIIQAPRKWIFASSITIFTISFVWIGRLFIRDSNKPKEVVITDKNGTKSAQLE